MRCRSIWIVVLCRLGLVVPWTPLAGQALPAAAVDSSPAVLDVPYLPQSELLCGGAALAMLERWWGRRGVYAEEFADLVRPDLRGIRTTDLVDAARARGWDATAFDGTPETVRTILASGVPVLALIAVAPGRYHYIVLLGWSGGRVTFHDPAVAPSRTWSEARLVAAWRGAERWAMTLRPATPSLVVAPPPASTTRPISDPLPCPPWLDQGLDSAAVGQLDASLALLQEAGSHCPDEPLIQRELAGVRFTQGRYDAAATLAGQYLQRRAHDPLGWRILAASRYLGDDRDGALRAWNRIGIPTIDLLRIDGLRNIRFAVLADAAQLPAGTVLTPKALHLAQRRIADIPALRRAEVGFTPVPGDRVEVRAVISERPVLAPAWRLFAGAALRALTQREVGVTTASPTGAGEVWSAVWRWEHAHPRVEGRVDLPVRMALSGTVGIAGGWERFRFGLDTAVSGVVSETRRSGGITLGSWVTPALRPTIGLRLERWSGARQFLVAQMGGEYRAADDRLLLSGSLERGFAVADHPAYARGNLLAMWASSVGLSRATWSVRMGLDLTSRQAPLGAWSVASSDLSWAIPLRAHPRTSDGLLPGATTSRKILHGGIAGDRPIYRTGPFTLAIGLFVDAAGIVSPADGSRRNRLYLDAGGGLRLGILDGQLGVLRADVATGLNDHRTAFTVGMQQSWPPFRENTR